MSVYVLRPGLLTTIQDLGRYGFQKFGVVVGGAMDPYALRIANLLVGNVHDEGCLEVTLFGTTLQFTERTLIAITGANLKALINGQPVPTWRPVIVEKDCVLTFQSAVTGCRAYIAFAGGIEIPKVMESKSTYIRAQIGGLDGRALHKGDYLQIGHMTKANQDIFNQVFLNSVNWMISPHRWLPNDQPQIIRLLRGADMNHFQPTSRKALLHENFTITRDSDRMGYRLSGSSLTLKEPLEKLSEGVTSGTIQVPPNGQPIVLMADRQTTGGYPVIGQVISVDLAKLAQLQPLQTIRFQEVSIEEAEQAFIATESRLRLIQQAVQLKLVK